MREVKGRLSGFRYFLWCSRKSSDTCRIGFRSCCERIPNSLWVKFSQSLFRQEDSERGLMTVLFTINGKELTKLEMPTNKGA